MSRFRPRSESRISLDLRDQFGTEELRSQRSSQADPEDVRGFWRQAGVKEVRSKEAEDGAKLSLDSSTGHWDVGEPSSSRRRQEILEEPSRRKGSQGASWSRGDDVYKDSWQFRRSQEKGNKEPRTKE
ncbi:hypothetical protein B9Z55_016078 [Caenorhabditis nigoni]|uniref:Uncharacterized protein n=1 Tax=Caenorhabditis nigoni TaxID=1611254 RepID=A0A2G5UD30_9PELO|nr:hypothetical protein B9Z55_016078 [Caenorhabditis nigoni]